MLGQRQLGRKFRASSMATLKFRFRVSGIFTMIFCDFGPKNSKTAFEIYHTSGIQGVTRLKSDNYLSCDHAKTGGGINTSTVLATFINEAQRFSTTVRWQL